MRARLTLFSLLLLMFVSTSLTYGQEVTPEPPIDVPPTETFTEIPNETATWTPSPLPTETTTAPLRETATQPPIDLTASALPVFPTLPPAVPLGELGEVTEESFSEEAFVDSYAAQTSGGFCDTQSPTPTPSSTYVVETYDFTSGNSYGWTATNGAVPVLGYGWAFNTTPNTTLQVSIVSPPVLRTQRLAWMNLCFDGYGWISLNYSLVGTSSWAWVRFYNYTAANFSNWLFPFDFSPVIAHNMTNVVITPQMNVNSGTVLRKVQLGWYWFAPPSPTPTNTPTSTPTETATPTATPNVDPILACNQTDANLLLSTLSAFGITLSGGWSLTELQQICLSVTRIGQAFVAQIDGGTTPPNLIFKEVMGVETNGVVDQGAITLIRVTTNGGICITDNNVRTITCGNLFDLQGNPRAITEFVITHEMGHVFDNQADRGNGRALRDYIGDTRLNPEPTHTGTHTNGPIWDANPTPGLVLGNVVQCNNSWLRGERGWGSGPGSLYNPMSDFCTPRTQVFTDYQQNTAPYSTDEQANHETAADMFLNWVYRKLAIGGFLNRDWRPHVSDPASGTSCNQIPQGCDNSQAAPGDARFNWTQTVMNEIFAARGWNN